MSRNYSDLIAYESEEHEQSVGLARFPVNLKIWSRYVSIRAIKGAGDTGGRSHVLIDFDRHALEQDRFLTWVADNGDEVNQIIDALVKARDYAFGGQP